MAYTKQTWTTGETIVASKLNNIETAIYNNSVSIDELNTNLSSLLTTAQIAFEASEFSSSTSTTLSKDVAKSGYTPIGIVGFSTGHTAVHVARVDLSGTTVTFVGRNIFDSAVTATPNVYMLYMKNS